jgi:hypothetical protein
MSWPQGGEQSESRSGPIGAHLGHRRFAMGNSGYDRIQSPVMLIEFDH